MLTGLLYAAVIAMWAVVLLPRWLGTSDRYRDARTTQRFRRSLRSVSARRHRSHDVAAMPGAQAGRVDTAPADAAIDQHLDLGIDPSSVPRKTATVGVPATTSPAKPPVPRPHCDAKRILTGLAAVSLVSVLGLVAGFVPMPLALLALAALAGYVYLLAAQSRARARGSRSPASSRRPCRYRGCFDATARHVGSGRGAGSSYLRAPRATAVPREIDSEENGPWTAERMLEQAAALRSGQDAEAELGLDEYAYPSGYETARAVNE